MNFLVRNFLRSGGSSMPSITTSSWLSAWPPPPMPPGHDEALDPVDRRGDRRRQEARLGVGAQREQLVAPRRGLQHAGRRPSVSAPHSPKNSESWIVRVSQRLEAAAERRAAHADGVDLVDEHDALAAPLGGQLLGLARHVADEQRVHADEHLREAGARDRHERAVERRRDRLREHRLAGAGRAEEEHAALALAARASRTPRRTARARRRAGSPPWPRPGRGRRRASRPSPRPPARSP